jgi:hypothetical protein
LSHSKFPAQHSFLSPQAPCPHQTEPTSSSSANFKVQPFLSQSFSSPLSRSSSTPLGIS